MIVQSELLGKLEVEPEELIRFPSGLLGFPSCRDFVLLQSERRGLYWLQSAELAPLVFVLVDPFLAAEGYSVELGPGDRAELSVEAESDVVVLAIVTLGSPTTGGSTANLQGPIAINLRSRKAKQLALDSEYGVRHPIDLAALA